MSNEPSLDLTRRLAFTPSPKRPRRADGAVDGPALTIPRLASRARALVEALSGSTARVARLLLAQVADAAVRGIDDDQAHDVQTVLNKFVSLVTRGEGWSKADADVALTDLAASDEMMRIASDPPADAAVSRPLARRDEPSAAPASPAAAAPTLQLPDELAKALTRARNADGEKADAAKALSRAWDAPTLRVPQPEPWPDYLGVNGFAPDDVMRLQIPADHNVGRSADEIDYMNALISAGADRDGARPRGECPYQHNR